MFRLPLRPEFRVFYKSLRSCQEEPLRRKRFQSQRQFLILNTTHLFRTLYFGPMCISHMITSGVKSEIIAGPKQACLLLLKIETF